MKNKSFFVIRLTSHFYASFLVGIDRSTGSIIHTNNRNKALLFDTLEEARNSCVELIDWILCSLVEEVALTPNQLDDRLRDEIAMKKEASQ